MANYPQLDDLVGVWKLKDVYGAKMGGYWRDGSTNALLQGGFTPGFTVEKYNFASGGNATVFGNLTVIGQSYYSGGMGSSTRAFKCGGDPGASPGRSDTIEYGIFASEGNYADFGNLTEATSYTAAAGNNTRIIAGSGNNPSVSNTISFFNPASEGNATDFGDLTVARARGSATSSPTRSIYAGGHTPSYVNTIDFVTTSTTGNATDFGDLVRTGGQHQDGVISSSTRGIFTGGFNPSISDQIQFITMASEGNATDFGNLQETTRLQAGASNSIIGILVSGYTGSYKFNIEKFNIASGGTTVDDGDTANNNGGASGASALHGGLNNGYEGNHPFTAIPMGGGSGQRALFMGGVTPSAQDGIETVNINSDGNANDFGNLSRVDGGGVSVVSSSLRAVHQGGFTSPANLNTME